MARLLFRTLLVLLVLLVVIGLMLPDAARVERATVINASPENVFPYINSMRRFHTWSPWTDLDPNTEYRFTGPESGVGSRMDWASGTAEVGQGSQEIIASDPPNSVLTRLVFGDAGEGSAVFELTPEGRGTRVNWRFETKFGWDLFGRYVGLMLDAMIGTAYEKGLATLKQHVETGDPAAPGQ